MTIPDTILSFLKKSNVFSAFKSFKAYAENHHGLNIKALQDDKGGEYMSNEMKQYLDENGIEALHTVRASPQQNGCRARQ
jgi:transposase InsO family protein